MTFDELFQKLWDQYSGENPSAKKIHDLFTSTGERIVNDHVAFRTYDDPRVSVDVIAKPFEMLGYKEKGTYQFEVKNLRARHYEMEDEPEAPRVFISELILDRFSEYLRNTVRSLLDGVPSEVLSSPDLLLQGTLFRPLSYEVYNKLREESEYAAWLYVFGYRANHFTVSINHLRNFEGIEGVNEFLKSNGFSMNSSGGEVKGTPAQLLEQSSTLADHVDVEFAEGTYRVPSCYYEFARRYPDAEGKLFSGFIAGSADKIFESTDFRK